MYNFINYLNHVLYSTFFYSSTEFNSGLYYCTYLFHISSPLTEVSTVSSLDIGNLFSIFYLISLSRGLILLPVLKMISFKKNTTRLLFIFIVSFLSLFGCNLLTLLLCWNIGLNDQPFPPPNYTFTVIHILLSTAFSCSAQVLTHIFITVQDKLLYNFHCCFFFSQQDI